MTRPAVPVLGWRARDNWNEPTAHAAPLVQQELLALHYAGNGPAAWKRAKGKNRSGGLASHRVRLRRHTHDGNVVVKCCNEDRSCHFSVVFLPLLLGYFKKDDQSNTAVAVCGVLSGTCRGRGCSFAYTQRFRVDRFIEYCYEKKEGGRSGLQRRRRTESNIYETRREFSHGRPLNHRLVRRASSLLSCPRVTILIN